VYQIVEKVTLKLVEFANHVQIDVPHVLYQLYVNNVTKDTFYIIINVNQNVQMELMEQMENAQNALKDVIHVILKNAYNVRKMH
jgi:hypothetical protein